MRAFISAKVMQLAAVRAFLGKGSAGRWATHSRCSSPPILGIGSRQDAVGVISPACAGLVTHWPGDRAGGTL